MLHADIAPSRGDALATTRRCSELEDGAELKPLPALRKVGRCNDGIVGVGRSHEPIMPAMSGLSQSSITAGAGMSSMSTSSAHSPPSAGSQKASS